MNKKLDIVPIFFSCDDKYIPYLAVTIESIVKHISKDKYYELNVLHANSICPQNQIKINESYSRDNVKINFVDISYYVEKFSKRLHTRDYYSKATYYRLFIPNLYKEYDKALYLDSDIVVLDDIANLYNIDLKDNLVGAIPDEAVSKVPEFINYVVNRIQVNSEHHYFNAGVLLMNLKKLREIDFEEVFINLIEKVTFNVAQDQDYLNTICKDRVHYIDKVWNKMPLPDENVQEKDIKLIHYNLSFKPWKLDNILYEDNFWDVASKTTFYNDIINEKKNYTLEMQENANKQTIDLIKLAQEQADAVKENEEIAQIVEDICKKKRA